jgi:hypothetical protein
MVIVIKILYSSSFEDPKKTFKSHKTYKSKLLFESFQNFKRKKQKFQ